MQKEHTITSITVDSVAELKNALASISRIRETGAGQPIAVKLRGGDYHFAETIEIGAAENETATVYNKCDRMHLAAWDGICVSAGFV